MNHHELLGEYLRDSILFLEPPPRDERRERRERRLRLAIGLGIAVVVGIAVVLFVMAPGPFLAGFLPALLFSMLAARAR